MVTRCDCGAPAEAVVFGIMHSRRLRLTFYRCTRCSREWTVREEGIDAGSPVDADEVIAAHEALQREDLCLDDLL